MTALLEVENLTVRFPMPKEGFLVPAPILRPCDPFRFRLKKARH